MKKDITNNSFTGGLVMDLNPLLTPNNVLTNCLNGTLITYNGNEQVLQNDMGNGRVETAMLPEGYIPLGTTELGGIIYIVSYNPLIGKCQIGSFPSPERNILSNETEGLKSSTLSLENFYERDELNKITDIIKSPFQRLILHDKELNPGDKFQIYCDSLKYNELTNLDNLDILSAVNNEGKTNPDLLPKYLKLNVVSIQEDGSIIKLNDSLIWNDIESGFKYYIKQADIENPSELDVDEYRKLVLSNYNVFNSKIKGKLAILAELECISAFDVSWDAKKVDNEWKFYFYLNWEYENTQARDQINLYGIRVNCKDSGGNDIIKDKTDIIINNYPNSNYSNTTSTDILENKNTIFYTPYYVDSIDDKPDYENNGKITIPRKNDGTDNQFLLFEPIVLDSNASGKVTFTVSPLMPFGCLDYLKKEFTIDLDLLNSGLIDLKLYKYYYESSGTTIYWGLDYYPDGKKKIKEACFNFYKFDKNVRIFVQNNTNLENDKRIDTKGVDAQLYWEELKTEVYNTNLIDPIKEKINQASYSGYFSNVITSLEDNQLYLVELDINYNDELNIKYYRFLYTCDIFNDEFYNEDDFKNIKLLDKLNIEVSSKFTPIYTNIKQTDPNIDHFKELKLTEENEYIVKDIYEGNMSGNIQYHTSKYNNLFNVSATTVIDDNSSIIGTFKNSPTSKILQHGNFPYDSGSIYVSSQHTFENLNIQDEIVKFSFNIEFDTPLHVVYNRLDYPNVLYELKPITILKKWLLWDGGHTSIKIGLTDLYSNEYDDKYTDKYGDDDHGTGPGLQKGDVTHYTNIHEGLKNFLENYDIIVLCCKVYHTAKSDDYPNLLKIGPVRKGSAKDDKMDNNFKLWRLYNNTNTGVFVMYAIKDINGYVRLFTYGNLPDNGYLWWNGITTLNPDDDKYETGSFGVPIAFSYKNLNPDYDLDLSNELEGELIFPKLLDMFKLYNKLSDYIISPEDLRYFYGVIKYFEDYKWVYDININNVNYSNMQIKINNTSINDLRINNLEYLNKGLTNIPISITNTNYVYKHILNLISNNNIYIKLSDSKIHLFENIKKAGVYSKDGILINYLKKQLPDNLLLDDSLHEISVEDEKLRINVNIPPTILSAFKNYGIFLIWGEVEELHITITEIININFKESDKLPDENTN